MTNHAAPANTKDKSGKVQTTVRNELTKLFTKAGVQCNDFQRSPAGGVVSIAYFATETCLFELFDVDNNTSFASRKHDRCTKLLWDPSGRYLASCTVTALRNAHAKGNPDDGVQFFTFQGNLLCHMRREKLFTFAWRPRPNLLTAEEKKEVMKNLKSYEKEFEKKDKIKKQEINQGLQASRFRIAEEFLSWKNGNRTACAALKAKRVELRNGYDSDDERNYRIERMVSLSDYLTPFFNPCSLYLFSTG
jgi:translation initiation factor 3 subunit B